MGADTDTERGMEGSIGSGGDRGKVGEGRWEKEVAGGKHRWKEGGRGEGRAGRRLKGREGEGKRGMRERERQGRNGQHRQTDRQPM